MGDMQQTGKAAPCCLQIDINKLGSSGKTEENFTFPFVPERQLLSLPSATFGYRPPRQGRRGCGGKGYLHGKRRVFPLLKARFRNVYRGIYGVLRHRERCGISCQGGNYRSDGCGRRAHRNRFPAGHLLQGGLQGFVPGLRRGPQRRRM